jgi:hypothetical protein
MPGSNKGLGVKFTPGLQSGFISERGTEMIHEISIKCTCLVGDIYAKQTNEGRDGRQTPFCDRCGGSGWLYRSPVLLTGLVTNVRYQKNLIESGFLTPGDLTFSPMPTATSTGGACAGTSGRRVGSFDKLTATWPEPIDDGHVLVRGAGTKAKAEGITTYLADNEDRLWYEPAGAIWCEDENGVVYTEDSDFELGPGKVIRWTGNSPIIGTRFTIKYNAYFEWIAFQPPTERIDYRGENLGELVYLRKKHAMMVNDSPFATSEDKESLQSRVRC